MDLNRIDPAATAYSAEGEEYIAFIEKHGF